MTHYPDPLCDLIGEAMSEPNDAEATLQFALVGVRNMTPEMQREFLVAVMDELCGLAKQGKVDSYFAGQLLTRAQLIASFVNAPQPGLRMVVNRA